MEQILTAYDCDQEWEIVYIDYLSDTDQICYTFFQHF